MKTFAQRTVTFKPGERNVFFHILTACNLSCRHCYINPEMHGNKAVAKEQLEAWLALFAAPDKNTNLVLLGGEPTLHPALGHAIRFAKRIGYRSVTVDSNGFLFHDLLASIGPEELDFLSFSLDGPSAEVNDPIRGRGVFAVCTANLKRAKKQGFHTSLIYTVSKMNLGHLHRMPALLSELGVDRFFIQVIGIRGQSVREGAKTLQLAPSEWLSHIPSVAEEVARRGIKVVFPKVFLDEKEPFMCAGKVAENFFIFPNGRVYLCPLGEDFAINTFQIEDGRLMKNQGLIEERLFGLTIPEGCVMNKLTQPDNLAYDAEGNPLWRISCCLLKEEI